MKLKTYFFFLAYLLLIHWPVCAEPLKDIKAQWQQNPKSYNATYQLAKEFLKYKVDSAFYYAKQAKDLAKNETDQAYAQLILGDCFFKVDNFDSAFVYIRQSKGVFQRNGLKDGLIACYNREAEYKIRVGDYMVSRKCLDSALMMGKPPSSLPEKRALCNTHLIASNYYEYFSIHNKAIEESYQALTMAEQMKDSSLIALAYYKIAGTHQGMEQWRDALDFYLKALPLVKKFTPFHLAMIYHSVSEPYIHLKKFDSSKIYMDSAEHWLRVNPNQITQVHFLLRKGHILDEEEKYDSAMVALRAASQIANHLHSDLILSNIDYWMGDVFLQTNRYDSSQYYFEQSFRNAQKNGHLQFMADANNALSILYEKKKDYKKSLDYSIAFSELMDTIFSVRKWNAVKASEIKYESQLKEKTIALQKQELKFTKAMNLLYLLLFLVVGFVSVSLYVFLRKIKKQHGEIKKQHSEIEKQNKEIEKQNKEIETQKIEILHISQNNFKQLINILEEQGETLGERTLAADNQEQIRTFSILLRLLLDNEDRGNYSLYRYVKEIMEAKKMSTRQHITMDLMSSDSELTLHYKDLSNVGLMVNELLTNAIKHAFHGVENPAIKLSFFHEKNCLILEYRDNGVGLNLDQLQSEKQGSFGSKLLHILTNKYKGTMTVENKEGTFIRWVLYV